LYSLKKMNANFGEMFTHACRFQRDNCTRDYQKLPVFARISKDVPRAHSFYESAAVLRGSSDIIALGQRCWLKWLSAKTLGLSRQR
jgi:hypothetical protein